MAASWGEEKGTWDGVGMGLELMGEMEMGWVGGWDGVVMVVLDYGWIGWFVGTVWWGFESCKGGWVDM